MNIVFYEQRQLLIHNENFFKELYPEYLNTFDKMSPGLLLRIY